MFTPLAIRPINVKRERPEVGDLVTWVDYAGRTVSGRLTDWRDGNAWITVAGLTVQHGLYRPGAAFTIDQSKVVDW